MQSHWYSSPFWLCLSLSVIVSVAPCNGQLVGPGAVTTFSGGGGRSRGGFATIRDPAAGFFVAGSSIKGMNGVYRRIAEEGVDERREVTLAYKNKFVSRKCCSLIVVPNLILGHLANLLSRFMPHTSMIYTDRLDPR